LPSFSQQIFIFFSVLKFENMYLERLPSAERYEWSYMHRDVVTHVQVTASDFVATASADGVLKFWKKVNGGMDFVKQFKAHSGAVSYQPRNFY